jgi:CheY-like chemotaxis protein
VNLSPHRVLIVEDDDAIRESLAEGLRENGLKVAVAEHGREALAILRTEPPPSAIVLDLMLPVMDGWDFRHEQLNDPALRDIPVVVITATGFSANTIRKQLGDVGVIAKPVRQLDLLDLLNRACSE